jgi:hypothetical protein
MRGARVGGILAMVLLVLCALMLLIFTCTHYGNWWSLFILLATGVAILVPNICWGYDTTDPALMDVQMEPDAFIRCQELALCLCNSCLGLVQFRNALVCSAIGLCDTNVLCVVLFNLAARVLSLLIVPLYAIYTRNPPSFFWF